MFRKERNGKGSFRKSKAWFLFRSWSVCECDEKVGRFLVRLEECALSVRLMLEGVVLSMGDDDACPCR